MYKVFFNNNIVFLSEESVFSNLPENTLAVKYEHDFPLELLINKAANENRRINYMIIGTNKEAIFDEFKSHFKFIEAAGGIIYNAKNEILGIYRREKWDLPKGKVDKNESFEEAAIRECREETGLISLVIDNKIWETYHTYFQNKPILKRTHWYKMTLLNDEPVIPQTEEDITEIKWFNNVSLNEFKSNTFASIAEVLTQIN